MTRVWRGIVEAVRNAFVDVLRRPLFALLAVLTMAVAVTVLAGFTLLARGAREFYGRLVADSPVEVYLRPTAAPDDVSSLEALLKRDPTVERVERISSEQALSEFVKLYPDLGDVRQLLGDNPLPASLRATVRKADPAAVAALVRAARAHPAAISVRYDREWIEGLSRVGGGLRLFALLGSAALMFAALVTVGAVVRLALDDKLDEVKLLRLVGAPASFVLAPVFLSGGILGGAGAAVALGAVGAARSVAVGWAGATPFGVFLRAALGGELPLGPGAALLAFGFAAGAISAGIAAGRAALR